MITAALQEIVQNIEQLAENLVHVQLFSVEILRGILFSLEQGKQEEAEKAIAKGWEILDFEYYALSERALGSEKKEQCWKVASLIEKVEELLIREGLDTYVQFKQDPKLRQDILLSPERRFYSTALQQMMQTTSTVA